MKYNVWFIILLIWGCSQTTFKSSWTEKKAPKTFKARFETTYGDFEIEAVRAWSPAAVDRLYQLIKNEFYSDMAIFRVVPGFVAQFGISNDSSLNVAWNSHPVIDEPLVEGNKKGNVAFARGGPGTRTSQIFINLEDNHRLDTIDYKGVVGFPAIAKVTSGMNVVLSFFDEYGNEPSGKQDSISQFGNEFLQFRYPELDYIERAYLID